MSLQAELVRLWLRWAMKRSNHPNVTIAERRRRMAAFERRVPRPPGWIDISERPLGGLPALRVRSLASHAVRQILFLCGWAPHSSQPQPLRRGSATHRLADAVRPLRG